jgi:hypothetical protein
MPYIGHEKEPEDEKKKGKGIFMYLSIGVAGLIFLFVIFKTVCTKRKGGAQRSAERHIGTDVVQMRTMSVEEVYNPPSIQYKRMV